MPTVPLTATKDFTYNTRRLKAGDDFDARNPLDARILTRVRKVADAVQAVNPVARQAAAPVADLKVEEPAEVKVAAPKAAAKKAPAKRKARAKK